VNDNSTPTSASRWYRLALGLALALVVGLLARDAFIDIADRGINDEQSSQILVVPVAVGLLLLARRKRFATVRLSSTWFGPLAILVGLGLWVYGLTYLNYTLRYLGPIVMVLGGLITPLGTDVVRKFAPAFIVLLFLIPIPAKLQNLIAVPMQEFAATITFSVAEVLGMGVTQAGRTLRINGQDVTVAEACSGMRMIFTLFLACYMSVFTLPLKPWYRAFILCITPLVAIVANVIRLVLTLWAYDNFDPYSADKLHTAAGWIMVLVAFFAMESIARFLQWLGIPTMIDSAVARRPTRSIAQSPQPAPVAS
jgi:exosortase